jgi:uncharacterized protein involved in exopolysaccharide biosynthesis
METLQHIRERITVLEQERGQVMQQIIAQHPDIKAYNAAINELRQLLNAFAENKTEENKVFDPGQDAVSEDTAMSEDAE